MDDYKYRLYSSLRIPTVTRNPCFEIAPLLGFNIGNQTQDGCLTTEQDVRLHSCEHGTRCGKLAEVGVVYITPIISRTARGEVIPELGAGGGANDLLQSNELQLNDEVLAILTRLCSEKVVEQELRIRILGLLSHASLVGDQTVSLDALQIDQNVISLDELVTRIEKLVDSGGNLSLKKSVMISKGIEGSTESVVAGRELPKTIVGKNSSKMDVAKLL